MIRIAAQLNTVRAYCGTQKEFLDTLSRIRALGFDGVELESSLLKNADRQTVACHLKELGLEVCSIRSPFARTGYGLEDMIAEAKAMNCVNVGVGTVTASYFTMGPAGMEKYLEQASKVCGKFSQEGVRPLYSLRFHEFMRQSDGVWPFDKLADRPETSDYLWETDVLSLTRTAVEPPKIFSRLAGRMPVCRQTQHVRFPKKVRCFAKTRHTFSMPGARNARWEKACLICRLGPRRRHKRVQNGLPWGRSFAIETPLYVWRQA